MRRTVSETRVGTKQIRYKVRIEDDPSAPGHQSGLRLITFMETLAQSPDLLNCGYSKPQRLSLYHSGTGWIAEGEATIEEG